LFDLLRNENNDKVIVMVYLVLWIFAGNFVILNLFLAILLEAFLDEGGDEEDVEELKRLKQEKKTRKDAKKKKYESKKVIMTGLNIHIDNKNL
jgi:hypothetical protein